MRSGSLKLSEVKRHKIKELGRIDLGPERPETIGEAELFNLLICVQVVTQKLKGIK
jgi:hypothetical protein